MPLKTCPWCLSKNIKIIEVEGRYQSECQNCGMRGPLAEKESTAEDAWNNLAK